MAKRSFSSSAMATNAGVADAAALTTLQYMHLDPASASQLLRVEEIFIGGLSNGTSAPQNMQFRRNTTAPTGAATALAAPQSDGPMNNLAAAITTVPQAAINFATTQPSCGATATQARLHLPFNAYGGIVRWQAAKDEEWWMVGTGVNVGSSLSNNTGSTVSTVSASMIYEMF